MKKSKKIYPSFPLLTGEGEDDNLPPSIKILTINVNGMTDKENDTVGAIVASNAQIILLTEIHRNTGRFENLIKGKGFNYYENPTHQNSWNGTAIIIKNQLQQDDNIHHEIIVPGRISKIKIKLYSSTFHIYCVYLTSGTDADDIEAKINQMNILRRNILANVNPTEKIILAGDFNILEDPIDTANPQNFKRLADRDVFLAMKQELAIKDAFRSSNPDKKHYTRIEGGSATRLDRIYISNTVNSTLYKTDFIDTVFSDHCSSPTLSLRAEKIVRWGKSRWQLNESLLTNENLKSFEEFWLEWKKKKLLYHDALSWWDIGKRKIRSFFIHKGSLKKKRQLNETKRLSEELNSIHEQIDLSTQEKKNRIAQIKFQLKNLADYKTTGQRIRSRVTKIDDEEENHTDFFKLESDNVTSKQITSITVDNLQITGKENIMDTVHNFWTDLWGKKKNIDLQTQNTYIEKNIATQQNDSPDFFTIPIDETEESLRKQNKKGSPGSDGLTPAFYLWAWSIIGEDLNEMLNNCYMCGSMSESMKTALVTLIPKKGDIKLLKNWRPVSLLNVDYKILAKIITKRLYEEVKNEISIEQKCALKGRQITDIHLNLLAALKNGKQSKDPIIITCYDYTKAFDMIDHSVIWTTLKKMKIKESTIKWIQIMYHNIISKIQVNGALTKEILILRGIRQGCPLSMLLFVIALESLARNLKSNTGVKAPYLNMKAQQYADDLTSITSDADSQRVAEEEITRFCNISGLELNRSKTNILYMNLSPEEEGVVRAQNHPEANILDEMKILGLYFNNTDLVSKVNWINKIQKMERVLKKHWRRDVSIFGKIKIINTLAISHLNLIAKLETPTKEQLKNINSILFKFLWAPRKMEQTSRSNVVRRKEDGGLGLPDMDKRMQALFFSRVSNLFGSTPQEIQEPWHWDALYHIGSRIVPINSRLYSNERLNADSPDAQYKKILEIHGKIQTEGLIWKDITAKIIYHYLNLRTSTQNTWFKILLFDPNVKPFFSNREREISWRTKVNAFKWTSFIETRENLAPSPLHLILQQPRSTPCFFCNTGEDTIHHLLIECDLVREIWISINNTINEKTTRRFLLDDSLIKYNMVPANENQESWLIPLKAVNIIKSNLLFWRKNLYLNDKRVEERDAWIQTILDQAITDLNLFLRTLMKNRTRNQLEKYLLKLPEDFDPG